ncbi:hypothetical protein FVE85_6335 [Porphyridium purpureum]|uniref:Uncharacterized protein n=1 Tax=Porphyridium purpureum TaxID=35688 RepID=A0A5J4Z688_PORPP|nr:hypothetical protein FVE85_6335 [Porphyridium purpureum]|eukprot:POR9032..scf295_1
MEELLAALRGGNSQNVGGGADNGNLPPIHAVQVGQMPYFRAAPPGFSTVDASALEGSGANYATSVLYSSQGKPRRRYAFDYILQIQHLVPTAPDTLHDVVNSGAYDPQARFNWSQRLAGVGDDSIPEHESGRFETSPRMGSGYAGRDGGSGGIEAEIRGVPELVPLDDSWLRSHPLLDGALEGNTGGLYEEGIGGLDDSLEPDSAWGKKPLNRRDPAREFVRPGFEAKVTQMASGKGSNGVEAARPINARAEAMRGPSASPKPPRVMRSPSPDTMLKSNEFVRFARGPCSKGGFETRKRRDPIPYVRKVGRAAADCGNLAGIHASMHPAVESLLPPHTEPALDMSIFLGMAAGGQSTSDISIGEDVDRVTSRGFGRWFTNPAPAEESAKVGGEASGIAPAPTAPLGSTSLASEGLAPNVLSFFNQVKAQAAAQEPKGPPVLATPAKKTHVEISGTDEQGRSEGSAPKPKNISNGDANVEFDLAVSVHDMMRKVPSIPNTEQQQQYHHYHDQHQQQPAHVYPRAALHQYPQQSAATSAGDVSPAVAPAVEMGVVQPQRFSAEAFFGMFQGTGGGSLEHVAGQAHMGQPPGPPPGPPHGMGNGWYVGPPPLPSGAGGSFPGDKPMPGQPPHVMQMPYPMGIPGMPPGGREYGEFTQHRGPTPAGFGVEMQSPMPHDFGRAPYLAWPPPRPSDPQGPERMPSVVSGRQMGFGDMSVPTGMPPSNGIGPYPVDKPHGATRPF